MKSVRQLRSRILKCSGCFLVPLAALCLWSCNLLAGSGTGLAGGALSAPKGISAVVTAAGDGEATVAWSPVEGATSYNLYWAKGPGVTTKSGTKVSGVSSPAVVNDLSQGSQYSFTVTAVNSTGESDIGQAASETIPTTSSHVYIAGSVDAYPAYWKDGVLHLLGSAAGYSASFITATADGAVYAVCWDFNGSTRQGAYWDNGTMKSLPLNSGESIAWFAGIAVSGSNAYVVATVNEANGTEIPVVWENGVRSNLPVGSDTHGDAGAIRVMGTGVYIVGHTWSNDTNGNQTDSNLVYWKTGALTVLDQGAGYSNGWEQAGPPGTGGLFIQGNDFYVYGETFGPGYVGVPVYWKDGGSPFHLTPTDTNSYNALSLFATGGSVYIAGETEAQPWSSNATPVYWKDGSEHALPLPSGVSVGSANGIVTSGSTTYIVGDETAQVDYFHSGEKAVPLYWKDGVLQPLTLPSGDPNAIVRGLALSGTDAYVVARTGTLDPNTGDLSFSASHHAVYWKNGAMNILPTGQHTNASLDSFTVLGY